MVRRAWLRIENEITRTLAPLKLPPIVCPHWSDSSTEDCTSPEAGRLRRTRGICPSWPVLRYDHCASDLLASVQVQPCDQVIFHVVDAADLFGRQAGEKSGLNALMPMWLRKIVLAARLRCPLYVGTDHRDKSLARSLRLEDVGRANLAWFATGSAWLTSNSSRAFAFHPCAAGRRRPGRVAE